MELLAKNALLYNGRESPYSADAASLLQSAIDQISTDTLQELEETVGRKVSLLHQDDLQYKEHVQMQEDCESQIQSSSDGEIITKASAQELAFMESSVAQESRMELA
jgi:LPS O-antigen subunit length determinant protein (WzzB/FepE family)